MTERVDYPPLASSPGGVRQITVTAVFFPIALVAVVLRLYSRFLKRQSLAANDYLILVALVLTAGLTAVTIISVVWAGSGQHILDVNPIYQPRILVIFAAGQPIWAAANTAVKISILLLYITIFPSRRLHICCYIVMALSTCYFLSVLLETFLLCKPVAFNWDKTIAGGTCSKHSQTAYIIAASLNLVIDVIVVALPMPVLWSLKLSRPKKIGIMSMFGLGAVICVITLLRVIFIARLNLLDFTYASVDLAVWSILEPTLGIVNASLPVLRPVGSKLLDLKAFQWARTGLRSLTTLSHKSVQSNSSARPAQSWGNRTSRGASERFQKLADPTDQLYPLDTIHLVGDTEQEDHVTSHRR